MTQFVIQFEVLTENCPLFVWTLAVTVYSSVGMNEIITTEYHQITNNRAKDSNLLSYHHCAIVSPNIKRTGTLTCTANVRFQRRGAQVYQDARFYLGTHENASWIYGSHMWMHNAGVGRRNWLATVRRIEVGRTSHKSLEESRYKLKVGLDPV